MERGIKIYIGYDPNEIVAFHTLVQSIIEHTTIPFDIIPLNLQVLPEYTRKDKGSTEFTYSRFLVPYLSGYKGNAIFMDCDMLVRYDLKELLYLNPDKAVHVVKHDYIPKSTEKFLGNAQINYPRKNWSSFVVWNCEHKSNKILTPEVVNNAESRWLHRFEFLDDADIGELDVGWNWLVGEYDAPSEYVKNVHWTLGGPYFEMFADVEFADEWRETLNKTTSTVGKG